MFQVSINIPFKNIWVIVRKQNFKQNFNLIVDAAYLPDQRQSISRNFSLKNPAYKIKTESYLVFGIYCIDRISLFYLNKKHLIRCPVTRC